MSRTAGALRSVDVTRVYRFNAGHRLSHPDRDEAWNLATYGKCSYPGGHGHNYTLWVTVRGIPSRLTGRLLDPRDLDRAVEEHVMAWLDHRNLDDVLDLEVAPVPSSEVLIVEIWDRLAPCVPPLGGEDDRRAGGRTGEEGDDRRVQLVRLRLSETAKNTFEYGGPPAAAR